MTRDQRPSPSRIAPQVAARGRRLQVASQPGETKVTAPDREHLRRHQKEPPAGPAHDAVPHQADAGERQLQVLEPVPGAEAENAARLAQLPGHRRDRLVEAEGDVPRLLVKMSTIAASSAADCGGRITVSAEQHQRQEGEDRHALQHVEQRHHDLLGGAVVGGVVAVGETEGERERVGRGHARDRKRRVPRQRRGLERDLRAFHHGRRVQREPGADVQKRRERKHDRAVARRQRRGGRQGQGESEARHGQSSASAMRWRRREYRRA